MNAGVTPKPEARLRAANVEAHAAKNHIEQVIRFELGAETRQPDEETAYFLLDQAQSAIARTRSHVAAYFEGRQ